MFKRAAQYVKEKTEGKSTDSDTPTAPEASPVVADIEVKDATVDEPAPRREKSEKKGKKKGWDKEDLDDLTFDRTFKQGFQTFDETDGIDKTDLMSMSLNLKAALQEAKPDQYDSFNYHPGWFVCSGVCNHSYHLDNIQKWLSKSKTCPMCGQHWDYQIILPIPLWPELDATATPKDKKALTTKLSQKLIVPDYKIFL